MYIGVYSYLFFCYYFIYPLAAVCGTIKDCDCDCDCDSLLSGAALCGLLVPGFFCKAEREQRRRRTHLQLQVFWPLQPPHRTVWGCTHDKTTATWVQFGVFVREERDSAGGLSAAGRETEPAQRRQTAGRVIRGGVGAESSEPPSVSLQQHLTTRCSRVRRSRSESRWLLIRERGADSKHSQLFCGQRTSGCCRARCSCSEKLDLFPSFPGLSVDNKTFAAFVLTTGIFSSVEENDIITLMLQTHILLRSTDLRWVSSAPWRTVGRRGLIWALWRQTANSHNIMMFSDWAIQTGETRLNVLYRVRSVRLSLSELCWSDVSSSSSSHSVCGLRWRGWVWTLL